MAMEHSAFLAFGGNPLPITRRRPGETPLLAPVSGFVHGMTR